jgi:hypothetical protein
MRHLWTLLTTRSRVTLVTQISNGKTHQTAGDRKSMQRRKQRYNRNLFIIFSPLSLVWKNKSSLIKSSCSVCACLYPPLLTFECVNQSLWNLVYHGTWAHLNSILHKSCPSVCMSVWCVSPTVARQRLGQHVPTTTNTCNNRRTTGHVLLYMVHVIWKESRQLAPPRTSS